MPNILFASNSISHFPGSGIGAPAWSYDSDRVPYSLEVPLTTKVSSPVITDPGVGNEWWFHFRVGSEGWNTVANEDFAEITTEDGTQILRLSFWDREAEGVYMYLTADGTNYEFNRPNLPWGSDQLRTMDIGYHYNGVNLVVTIYMNELILHTFDIPVASYFRPARLLLGGAEGNSGGEGVLYFSEIIVADGDTRNGRLDLLRPSAVGAHVDWNGPVSSLADDDPTTGMTTTAANQDQSTILTPYTGANNISNIVQVTTTVRGLNAPENMRHLVRLSAVDYLSTDTYAIPFEKEYQVTDWDLNPATSLPWSSSDLASIEFGFRSLA